MQSELEKGSNLSRFSEFFNRQQFQSLHEEISFSEYLDRCLVNPKLIRSAYQVMYDMIMSKGTKNKEIHRKTYVHYNFFDDPESPIFGIEKTLHEIVQFFRGAAGWHGPQCRFLLLHGPVGSSKSTICRALKRGLEKYSLTDEGAWYTFKWVNLPDTVFTSTEDECPMHEDPIKLMPPNMRKAFLLEANAKLRDMTPEADRISLYNLRVEGDLNPRCKKFMEELLKVNNGDWNSVIERHIRVIRKTYSEADRMGIATFQPKDEKNQDSTELTGDIAWNKISHYGSDSDPRAFNYDGEFCVSNRGYMEFIEVLKLAKEFLYDLLGASQERQIKPKKFAQIALDTVLMGHTNTPEYLKLKADPTMEALKDRTVKIDVPYLLTLSDEIKVLEHYYGKGKVKQHIAPHTLEIAALWAVMTRLEEDHTGKVSLVDKVKLYDGRSMPGHTPDSVKEMMDKNKDEGFVGISCRYVQDKIANCLSSHHDSVNMFMVINELQAGLEASSLHSENKDLLAKYLTCIDLARKELDEILKSEVQKALVGDEDAVVRLCTNYIDNLMASLNKTKIRNKITGQDQLADEKLMRSIEEKIGVSEGQTTEFRRSIAAFIGDLAVKEEKFNWASNPLLRKALEAKLFEDTRDHIKLSALNMKGSSVVDKDIQDKIDSIKKRLIAQYGYDEKSATDVLEHVGSIFARGDLADDD
jgi:serine protein kinase